MCSGTTADVLCCKRSLWVPHSLRLNASVVVAVCFGAGSPPEPASLLPNSPVPRFNALSEVRYRCWQTQTTSFDTAPLIRANGLSSRAYFYSFFFHCNKRTNNIFVFSPTLINNAGLCKNQGCNGIVSFVGRRRQVLSVSSSNHQLFRAKSVVSVSLCKAQQRRVRTTDTISP